MPTLNAIIIYWKAILRSITKNTRETIKKQNYEKKNNAKKGVNHTIAATIEDYFVVLYDDHINVMYNKTSWIVVVVP